MKKNKKKSGLSPIALILIITTSIVAAVGIILLVLKFIQKKREQKALDMCGCCDCGDLDGWEFDDDMLGELSFDDDEYECECCHCAECEDDASTAVSDEISAAVDEAIEAIGAVTDELNSEEE